MAGQHTFEWGGPYGPAALIILLPAVVYSLFYGCNAQGCLQITPEFKVPGFPAGSPLFTIEALAVYCAWFLLILVLHLVLPGERKQGVLLKDGTRLTYKLNSFSVFLLTYGAALGLGFFTDYLDLSWVYDNVLPLYTASVIFSFALSIFLYVKSYKKNAMLADHGATGYFFNDFWMGRELNPRTGSLDWKEFCELYPGMIGWVVINLCFAHAQKQKLGYITNSMYLVNAFHLYYTVDALWNEGAILTTMDIVTDGFGFMLVFGDLSWVPFTFTSATRFLVDYPQQLGTYGIAAVLIVKLLGYWIFRGANNQKDVFRRDPNHPSVKHIKTLKTERGTQLMISGWWGLSRHMNYFGDWIMGVAWCMPTGLVGLRSVIPYFYCIYFFFLLVHRERRDDTFCRQKYGKDWDKYCSIVKYRIIPYVY